MEAEREAGYFIIKVMVLGILLIAMSSSLLIFMQARRAGAEDGCRIQAAYLAQMEFAAAEELIYNGQDLPNSLPWLGSPDDLQFGEMVFRVESELRPCPEGQEMHVNVSWEKGDMAGNLDFERIMVRHGEKK